MNESPTGALLAPLFKNTYVVAVLALIDLAAGSVTAAGLTIPSLGLPQKVLAIAAFTALFTGQLLKTFSPGLRKSDGPTAAPAVPPVVAPTLLAVLAAFVVLSPAQASAQALSLGPAAPLMAITPGDSHPVAFSPGTGFSVSCDLLATKLNGQPVYWFSPGAAILGTASSNGTTTALGVSAALYVAVLGLVTIGVGAPLIDSLNNGLFQHPDKRTPFIMFGLDHGFGTFLNALGIGHAPPPAPVDKPIDGDHPNGV